MTMILHRAADEADAAAIANLHVANWRDASLQIFEPHFLDGPIEEECLTLWSRRLTARLPTLSIEAACAADQQLVGFIAIYRDHDPHWGSLVDNLHVSQAMRGRRIGERLLRSGAYRLQVQGAEDGLHLWVFEANTAGIRFYQRLGGRIVGRDRSCIPAANGKPVLRIHWPELSMLSCHDQPSLQVQPIS